ncbi:hypothetical protein SK128_025321 [Halocaridina rubra]|uniref:Uncharacterized protein n=1 Tax=Halocaridina rubra TaxID=373956 RepID=A0AAN8X1U2_HALRR
MLFACYLSSIALNYNAAGCVRVVGSQEKESIRDQFVAGILNEDLAEKIDLLNYSKDGVLTLDDVVEYARTYNDVQMRARNKRKCKCVRKVRNVILTNQIPKKMVQMQKPIESHIIEIPDSEKVAYEACDDPYETGVSNDPNEIEKYQRRYPSRE